MFRAIVIAAALAAPTVAAAQDVNWTGLYAGVIGGADISHGRFSYPTSTPYSGLGFGANAGVLAGADIQVENVVLGLSISASPLVLAPGDQLCGSGGVATTWSCSLSAAPYATLQGRVGMPIDNLLVYATGGVALVRVAARIEQFSPDGQVLDYNDFQPGYVGGVGIEAPFMDTFRVRAEYLLTGALPFDASRVFGGTPVRVSPISSQFRLAAVVGF